jgi:hypothetical protein
MKSIYQLLLLSHAAFARSMNQQFHGNVKRYISGNWLDSMSPPRTRRADIDPIKGFRTLAVMMAYADGFGSDGQRPDQNIAAFEDEVDRLESVYTNYGCYCWIDGVDAGVIGGGKTKDMTDHHCKELYRCYKCVNIDYDKNYTDVSYNVDLSVDETGARSIDCKVNGKQDAENICECDKRFAENIANVKRECAAGAADNEKHGPYCMTEELRTITGKRTDNGQDGTFDSRNTCEKQFPDHTKDQCCGLYPNRLPYDTNFAECCQLGTSVEDVLKFRKLPAGQCDEMAGQVVVSVKGNPSSYVAAGAGAFAPLGRR